LCKNGHIDLDWRRRASMISETGSGWRFGELQRGDPGLDEVLERSRVGEDGLGQLAGREDWEGAK